MAFKRALLPLFIYGFAVCTVIFAMGRSTREEKEQPRIAVKEAKAAPPSLGERVMTALAASYPEYIDRAEYRNGDWAVLLNGRWFYYADGKLLPEELLPKASEYAKASMYRYFPELPPWKEPEGDQAEKMRTMLKRQRANPPKRSPDFLDELWGAHSRDEVYENVIEITFLGKYVLVHKAMKDPLEKVEAQILKEAEADPALKKWIRSIGQLTAWNWRTVAETNSRSYHAYGVAVDIQPKNTRGLQTYWQWTAIVNDDWYKVPYSERWHPPDAVIKAFETYGFCWGGKWPMYDTMHFEYRPEILLLNNMPVQKK